MITIRKGTFETNSSSCHTMTLTTSDVALKKFNEGKLIYAYLCRKEGFYTFQELAETLLSTIDTSDFDDVKNGIYCSLYDEEYVIGGWSKDTDEDFENIKEWMKTHFNENLLEWALTDKKDPDMFPIKTVIRNFIRAWADEICIGPLLTIKDFRNGCGRADFYKMDGSDVYWNNELGEMVAYGFDGIDSNNLRLRFDFRD